MTEEIGIAGQPGDLLLAALPESIDADDLLVEVVEGRPGRPQPVLEGRDIADERVHLEHPLDGPDGEIDVLAMLARCQRPRPGQLVLALRTVDMVTTGDDDIVEAAEEPQFGEPPPLR